MRAVHAFSGFDTTRSIIGIGKIMVLRKFASNAVPHDAIATFHDLRVSKENIRNAGIAIIQYFFGKQPNPLGELRFKRCNQQMIKTLARRYVMHVKGIDGQFTDT